MKALVKVGYGCNNHCTFCHTYDVRDVDASTEEVDRKIDRAVRLGSRIVLGGTTAIEQSGRAVIARARVHLHARASLGTRAVN